MYSTQIAKANNRNRLEFDGLWKSEDNIWNLTCLHGDEKGNLTLQWDNVLYGVTFKNLRITLSSASGVRVPDDEKLVVSPCYPKEVKDIHKKEIRKYHIKVMGNWSEPTVPSWRYWEGVTDVAEVIVARQNSNKYVLCK
jgi:hypothetical protein